MAKGRRNLSGRDGRTLQLAIAMALMTLLIMVLACGEKNTYVPPPPPKVTVMLPIKKPVTDYLEFTGNAVAYNTVPLKARVEGFLDKVLFKDGEFVTKGRLLFLIQPEQYQAQLQKAQAKCWPKSPAGTRPDRVRALLRLVKEDAAAQTDVDSWHYERDSSGPGSWPPRPRWPWPS